MKTITVESQQNLVEIEFTLTWEDYDNAERSLRKMIRTDEGRTWHRLYPWLAAAVLFVIGGLLAKVSVPQGNFGMVGLVLILLAPLILAAGIWFAQNLDRDKFSNYRSTRPCKQQCIASSDGVQFLREGSRIELPWSAVRQIYRLNGNIALFADNLHYHLVPCRAFVSDKQQARFLRLSKAGANGSVTV
jgi:hypothetical protein